MSRILLQRKQFSMPSSKKLVCHHDDWFPVSILTNHVFQRPQNRSADILLCGDSVSIIHALSCTCKLATISQEFIKPKGQRKFWIDFPFAEICRRDWSESVQLWHKRKLQRLREESSAMRTVRDLAHHILHVENDSSLKVAQGWSETSSSFVAIQTAIRHAMKTLRASL